MLIGMIAADPSLGEPLVPGLPYLRAEATFVAEYEMAITVDDVLNHRTRARLLARDASADAAESVATLLAESLGWSADEQAAEVTAYRSEIELERQAHAAASQDTGVVRAREPGWVPGARLSNTR